MARRARTSGDEARRFVEANTKTPLGVRYLGHYLDSAGRDRRWGDYLAAATREPKSEKLRCYYARAKRGRGAQEEAWKLAERLFVSPSSVHDSCDPLFRLWRAQGGLSKDLIWERAKLAFAARERGLLRYTASLGGNDPALSVLQRVYQEPQRVEVLVKDLPQPERGEVLALGLERHSRYDPARALRQFQGLATDELTLRQHERVADAIAFRGLLERDEGVRHWVDKNLATWRKDRLTELRLRWAISESDWKAIEAHVPSLNDGKRQDGAWRYWLARAQEASGDKELAKEALQALAEERSYYGFLSADYLQKPYSYLEEGQTQEDPSTALPAWAQSAALRVQELQAIDEPRLAQAEWTHTLQRLDAPAQYQLAQLAHGQEWYRLAIDAANASRHWNALDLRFPLAYVDDFQRRAQSRAVPVSELMAIARRESAFFPSARSPVGARGLMQLMPSTGIAVARKEGIPLNVSDLYSVEHNLDLGSAYYRQLLDRFDGKRPVALAAYNAGPNRVQHWIGRDLPLDAWIETIPYRETRDYVKAVLAYSVVFDHRLGQTAQLLTTEERRARF